jgi:hypothetical protein
VLGQTHKNWRYTIVNNRSTSPRGVVSGTASQAIYYAANIVRAAAGANAVLVSFTSAALYLIFGCWNAAALPSRARLMPSPHQVATAP